LPRLYIQNLPYCVKITELAPHIPIFGSAQGFISCTLNRWDEAVHYDIDTTTLPHVTFTFTPSGRREPSISTVRLARIKTGWGKQWWAFDMGEYGITRKLWFVPALNRFCCRKEGGMRDKASSSSRHQSLVLRAERLGKKLLEAQKKYPRLAQLLEMQKDLDGLNHRIHNEAKT
jgi:hypothetical protein